MGAIVRIEAEGQITLPEELRKSAGLADGDLLEAIVRDGNIVLVPREPERKGVATDRRAAAMKWLGSGKGLFATKEEADSFIGRERDSWG
jgi:AbrB family looped-hinge helix DNA binding protein